MATTTDLTVAIFIIGPLSEQIFILLYLWNNQFGLLLLKTISMTTSDTFHDIFLTFSFVFSFWNPVLMEKEKVLLMGLQGWWKDWESYTSNNWISCQHFRRLYKIKRINSTGREHCLHTRCSARCWAVFLSHMLFMCCPTYCFALVMGAHMLDRWKKNHFYFPLDSYFGHLKACYCFYWGSYYILGNVM